MKDNNEEFTKKIEKQDKKEQSEKNIRRMGKKLIREYVKTMEPDADISAEKIQSRENIALAIFSLGSFALNTKKVEVFYETFRNFCSYVNFFDDDTFSKAFLELLSLKKQDKLAFELVTYMMRETTERYDTPLLNMFPETISNDIVEYFFRWASPQLVLDIVSPYRENRFLKFEHVFKIIDKITNSIAENKITIKGSKQKINLFNYFKNFLKYMTAEQETITLDYLISSSSISGFQVKEIIEQFNVREASIEKCLEYSLTKNRSLEPFLLQKRLPRGKIEQVLEHITEQKKPDEAISILKSVLGIFDDYVFLDKEDSSGEVENFPVLVLPRSIIESYMEKIAKKFSPYLLILEAPKITEFCETHGGDEDRKAWIEKLVQKFLSLILDSLKKEMFSKDIHSEVSECMLGAMNVASNIIINYEYSSKIRTLKEKEIEELPAKTAYSTQLTLIREYTKMFSDIPDKKYIVDLLKIMDYNVLLGEKDKIDLLRDVLKTLREENIIKLGIDYEVLTKELGELFKVDPEDKDSELHDEFRLLADFLLETNTSSGTESKGYHKTFALPFKRLYKYLVERLNREIKTGVNEQKQKDFIELVENCDRFFQTSFLFYSESGYYTEEKLSKTELRLLKSWKNFIAKAVAGVTSRTLDDDRLESFDISILD